MVFSRFPCPVCEELTYQSRGKVWYCKTCGYTTGRKYYTDPDGIYERIKLGRWRPVYKAIWDEVKPRKMEDISIEEWNLLWDKYKDQREPPLFKVGDIVDFYSKRGMERTNGKILEVDDSDRRSRETQYLVKSLGVWIDENWHPESKIKEVIR